MLFNQAWKLKAGVSCPAVIANTRNRWFISDTHFFHAKLLTFEKKDGHKCRSQFSCIEEMNELMVERWNARVKQGDKVWHLGDVALGLSGKEYETVLDPFLSRLNGRKNLVVGNHDKIKNRILHKHFQHMELWKHYGKDVYGAAFILTHIPQDLGQLRKANINLHGHIHDDLMDKPNYINVCCEHTNYAPVHLDEILTEIRKRGLA